MDQALVERLRKAQQYPARLVLADGSELLVLPYGGRLLGLYASGDARNFLWTNPALSEEDTAKQFFAASGWPNSGGDRTWLAPEIDFFFPDFPALTTYVQPAELDPGSYQIKGSTGELHLGMEFTATPRSTNRAVQLRLSKTIRATANPRPPQDGVQYAGYETEVVLEALSPLFSAIGQWQLLQMPWGGEMIIPTHGRTKPLVVFGQPPEEDLQVTERALRYRMAGAGDHKISLPALASTGRVGYFYESEGQAQLIVRNFVINPSGEYVDANWTNPADRGYGVQACQVNGVYGCFSELEYHVPAITPEEPVSRDVSQVWAYRGERRLIKKTAEELLGVAI